MRREEVISDINGNSYFICQIFFLLEVSLIGLPNFYSGVLKHFFTDVSLTVFCELLQFANFYLQYLETHRHVREETSLSRRMNGWIRSLYFVFNFNSVNADFSVALISCVICVCSVFRFNVKNGTVHIVHRMWDFWGVFIWYCSEGYDSFAVCSCRRSSH